MREYDVVVLGSGAAGLTSALAAADSGAHVGLYEKASLLGGTTCLSSGVAWLPNNRHGMRAGVADSRGDAVRYLNSLSRGMILPSMAETFVDTVGELLEWLESHTPLGMSLVSGYPDYHPEHPGGKPSGGRSVEPRLFSMNKLGHWADYLEGTARSLRVAETPIGGGTGVLEPAESQHRRTERLEGLGRAMIAALLRGCLDRGIQPALHARARELVMSGGRVVGVRLDGQDGPFEVTARHGVVIATGGFEWNAGLVRDFLRGPMEFPATVPSNTGDGLRMAMKVGARLGNMREAWWVPVCLLPGEHNHGEQAVYLVQRERTVPRSIMVNGRGVRFTNEAANYNALGGAFHQLDPSSFDFANRVCWLLYDSGHVRDYGGFGAGPGEPVPNWVTSADSVRELGERLGIDPATLEGTVQQWNKHVAGGSDPNFGRGESAFDGYVGDRNHYPGTGSTLGPLDTPPYYAVRLHISTLGTKGGPRTDTDGAILDIDGAVIPGLYAAGNAMAGPTGMAYGGAGGTLGPALVFGYRAGRAVAGHSPIPHEPQRSEARNV